MQDRNAPITNIPRPHWLTVRAPSGTGYREVHSLVERLGLHTVCHSAGCPNVSECWGNRTATFMILGDTCTRDCGFCGVGSGVPSDVDQEEPSRVAEAVAELGLRYAVITSVTRDDLPDGGAGVFAETIRAIHSASPDCGIEALIPDFQGDEQALRTVLEAVPDVLNHNIETAPRLYPTARPQADYRRSLRLLAAAKDLRPETVTKSGLMVGLGEEWDEVLQVMADLREAYCDVLTIGQYLSPTRNHLPVAKYYTTDEFEALRQSAMQLGFGYVESGPLVRSSYRAHEATTRAKEVTSNE